MSSNAIAERYFPIDAPQLVSIDTNRSRFEAACFIPELANEQLRARQIARLILDTNTQKLRDGYIDDVPLPVDPLGTANSALVSKEVYGQGSPEYQEAKKALTLDCNRLYLEALRAKTWEYFPKTNQYRDDKSDHYYSHGFAIATLTEKGLSPVAEKEEQQRRTNEHVEELTYEAIGRGVLKNTVQVNLLDEYSQDVSSKYTNVTTISQCTNWALKRYQEGHTDFGGYVPSKNRLMIRNVRFNDRSDYREQDQLGLPGDYFDEELVATALWILDNRLSGNQDRTEVHATQIVSKGEVNVWDFAELLDQLASKKYGQNIFLGEVLAEGVQADYNLAKIQANKRYNAVMQAGQDLADDILAIAESGVDSWASRGIVERLVDRKIKSICEQNPEKARYVYDDATADRFKQLKDQMIAGDVMAVNQLRQDINQNAPRIEYCGGGSCGLKDVDLNGSYGKEIIKELNIKKDEIVVRDVQRPCMNCGKTGGVIYAYEDLKKSGATLIKDKGLVKKYCEHCKAKEIKINKVK